MARKTSPNLTEAEQRVMRVLWEEGSLTVRQVFEILSKQMDVAYTTIQTILTILEKKNYVNSEKEDRAYVFSAIVSKREAQSEALKTLVQQFFNGSPQALAQHLISESDADLIMVDELQKMIDENNKEDKE